MQKDMVFNNIDFTNLVRVENIRRDILPPRIIHSHKVPGKMGQRFSKVEMDTRIIEADIRLIEDTRTAVQEKARTIAGLLHTEEPTKLFLRDELTRYNVAILSDTTDLEKFLHTGFTTLQFLCLDPLAYSIEKSKITLGPSTTIFNNGTYETTGTMIVDINTTINLLEVLLYETGEKIYIEDSFAVGDKVVIDLDNEFVKKNGILIMNKVHITSDFFKLPKGQFTLKLSSGTGILEFRKAWL